MTTALATLDVPVMHERGETPPSKASLQQCSVNDLHATIADGLIKLRTLVPYISEMRRRFAIAPRGKADIVGCATWSEYCEKFLHRDVRHVANLLQEVQGIPSTCSECGGQFPSKGQLKKHRRNVHPTEQNDTRRDVAIVALEPAKDPWVGQIGNWQEYLNLAGEPFSGQGEDFTGRLIHGHKVHHWFGTAPRDDSRVWLVENPDGTPDLWRACDLSNFEERGAKQNKRTHGIFGVSNESRAAFREWLRLATIRLEEIKTQPTAQEPKHLPTPREKYNRSLARKLKPDISSQLRTLVENGAITQSEMGIYLKVDTILGPGARTACPRGRKCFPCIEAIREHLNPDNDPTNTGFAANRCRTCGHWHLDKRQDRARELVPA
jgi:hypothetical protein